MSSRSRLTMRRGRGAVAPSQNVSVRTRRTQTQQLSVGSKSIFTGLSQEQADALGFKFIPSTADINTYTAAQLYEMVYGGSPSYFLSPPFDGPREQERVYMENIISNVNVVESIYTCSNCLYHRIIVDQKQLRGGDESATSLYRCVRCGHSWANSS